MSNERLNFDKNLETLQKLNFQLLYASTSKYEGDWQSLPHTHHFTELFYVISGLGKFLVEDRLITVKENDMVIVNPNVEHTEKSMDSKPLEYIVFGVEGLTFSFGTPDIPENYGYYNYSAEKKNLLNFSQLMLREIKEKRTVTSRYVTTFWKLFSSILRETTSSASSPRMPPACPRNAPAPNGIWMQITHSRLPWILWRMLPISTSFTYRTPFPSIWECRPSPI